MSIRTDLACEVLQSLDTPIPGVEYTSRRRDGFGVESVAINTSSASEAIGKPQGHYITLELGGLMRREDDAFYRASHALAEELSLLLPNTEGIVLVTGLGNRNITPDSIGPEVVRWTMATRHLRDADEMFHALRPVAALAAGVLGDTGMESAELIAAVCRTLHPECVIAVDALASRDIERLCRTVQLSDTGIVPGSGVGNRRAGINSALTGCPVIAVGVPTVVDARTLAADVTGRDEASIPPESARGLIVTPREIDRDAADISRLVGYALNLALQPTLDIADLDMLLG